MVASERHFDPSQHTHKHTFTNTYIHRAIHFKEMFDTDLNKFSRALFQWIRCGIYPENIGICTKIVNVSISSNAPVFLFPACLVFYFIHMWCSERRYSTRIAYARHCTEQMTYLRRRTFPDNFTSANRAVAVAAINKTNARPCEIVNANDMGHIII